MAQTVNILDAKGKKSGDMQVSDGILGVECQPAVIRQALDQFLANRRQGTHSTKNRSKIRGSQAKPWRQKGTGRARAGTRKSGIWRGGGAIFGPMPRSYNQRLNKKMKAQAITALLTEYQRSGRLFVVESVEIKEPKTRLMVDYLQPLDAQGRILLVFEPGAKDQSGHYDQNSENVFLSARNLPYLTPLTVNNLNVFDLLNNDSLIMTQQAVQIIEERYG